MLYCNAIRQTRIRKQLTFDGWLTCYLRMSRTPDNRQACAVSHPIKLRLRCHTCWLTTPVIGWLYPSWLTINCLICSLASQCMEYHWPTKVILQFSFFRVLDRLTRLTWTFRSTTSKQLNCYNRKNLTEMKHALNCNFFTGPSSGHTNTKLVPMWCYRHVEYVETI
jgi:hypothetical protein